MPYQDMFRAQVNLLYTAHLQQGEHNVSFNARVYPILESNATPKIYHQVKWNWSGVVVFVRTLNKSSRQCVR